MSGENGIRLGYAEGRMRKSAISIVCAITAIFAVMAPNALARHALTHTYTTSFPAPFGAPGGENSVPRGSR